MKRGRKLSVAAVAAGVVADMAVDEVVAAGDAAAMAVAGDVAGIAATAAIAGNPTKLLMAAPAPILRRFAFP
jgi:hypothetical protein